MQRNASYFQVIAGNGYFLVIVFAVLFYVVAWLIHKGRISADVGAIIIISYWIGSVLYFISAMSLDFRRFYKFFLGRMRSKSGFAWIAVVYIMMTLLCSSPANYFLPVGFYGGISMAIKSYSLKILIASYGASLFYSMIVMATVVNIVAAKRGVQCFRARTKKPVGVNKGYADVY
jgi:hypothetical protein